MERVLPASPRLELADYVDAGGGRALTAARRLGPDAVLEDLHAAGLRGRGGAGFPTGQKWAAVRTRASADLPSTVVVNAAEGEPGSFKDRTLVRRDPFAVLEGAIVAARCVAADRVVVAVRRSCTRELTVMERAMAALHDAGWSDDVALELFAGPEEYLFGEETALLEALDGRPPFPRLQAPFRHGADEIYERDGDEPVLAARGGVTGAPPSLVHNAETMAHVTAILAHGASWFREVGTDASPGTILCTVSGDTERAGVGEFAMGTPLGDIIDELGGGTVDNRGIAAVMSGVSHGLVSGDRLDTPTTHEAMDAVGSGLGSAGFLVLDDETDFIAVAEGVSRFLSVESCGQCTPCKQDGLRITELLHRFRTGDGNDLDRFDLDARLRDVADSAICGLARQHQAVVGDLRTRAGAALRERASGIVPRVDPMVVAVIDDIVDGHAVLDDRQADKQPDWTFGPSDSGEAPADRYGEGRPVPSPPTVEVSR